MIATISHDLRTPLNQINGMVSLLRPLVQGKALEYISVCEEATAMMINLVNDTLDLYKIKLGEFDIKPVLFNLEDLSQKMESLFKFSLKEKKLEWKTEIETDILG